MTRITELVEISEAAPLLEETGIGPVTAAVCLTAWSHRGRIRSEAAYTSLAGVDPIPAHQATLSATDSTAAATDA